MDVSALFQTILGRAAGAARSEVDRYSQWAQGLLAQAQQWPAIAASGVTCGCRLVTPSGPALCRMPGVGLCYVCGNGVCLDHVYLGARSMVCAGCVASAKVLRGPAPPPPRTAPSTSAPTRVECLKEFKLRQNATPEKIKERYRALVKKYHPDLAKNEDDRKEREARLKRINAAYVILTAPQATAA